MRSIEIRAYDGVCGDARQQYVQPAAEGAIIEMICSQPDLFAKQIRTWLKDGHQEWFQTKPIPEGISQLLVLLDAEKPHRQQIINLVSEPVGGKPDGIILPRIIADFYFVKAVAAELFFQAQMTALVDSARNS